MSIKQAMIDLNEKMNEIEEEKLREKESEEIKEEIDYLCQILGKIF
jgi:hypothetical protein